MASPKVGHLVVSPCVLTELDYLVATRQGPPTAGTILRYVASRVAAGRWEVPGIGPLLLAAHAVLGDYPVIGLADAMNVVLAREFRTNVIATLDQGHFRVIPHSPPTALSACCQPTYPRAFPDAAPCGDRSLVSAQAE